MPENIEATLKRLENAMFEKYGKNNAAHVPEIIERKKQTNLKIYGFENQFANAEIKNKIKETNLKKFGTENPMQNDIIKKKTAQTILEKFGVENISQNEDIKKKKQETTFLNYGVLNPMQNLELWTQQSKTKFQTKSYKDTNLTYQGSYEFYFLELMEKFGFLSDVEPGKTYWYVLNNKKRMYYTDFVFRQENIEIKSGWTYDKNGTDEELKVENEVKWQSVRDFGDKIKILINKPEILMFVESIKI